MSDFIISSFYEKMADVKFDATEYLIQPIKSTL